MVAETPDGADCGDSDRVGLVVVEASDGALEEGGDGGLLQVGRELGAHPETAAKEERVSWAVQVGEHDVAHEAAKVELDEAFVDLRLDRLLSAAKGKHCCFMYLIESIG